MYGYKVSFEGLPKTVIACETKVCDYYWKNTHQPDMLEISISKAKHITRFENGKQNEYHDVHTISCKTAEEGCYSFSDSETVIEITSVIVKFPKLYTEKKILNPDDLNDKTHLLLPDFFIDATPEQLNEINILLHRYIHYNSSDCAEYETMRYSVFFEILGKLDYYVRNSISPYKEESHNQYYIKKINSIIDKNFSKKITASEIAEMLGITTVYMSSMYKKATGITITDYLLMTRMKKAEELLEKGKKSTFEIATSVGYENEGSFRKKFREYFGMNIREYRLIKQGNALYHNKPVRYTDELTNE